MVLAFILLVLVIVFVFYWKIQAVRSKCLDASFYRRRVGERNKIRIAVMCDDAILMRPFDDVGMVKKWDLPFETYVGANETIECALLRMASTLGEIKVEDIRFCLKHRSDYMSRRGVVYLFLVYCSDDGAKKWKGCEDCALWNVDSIDGKLDQGVFGDMFIEEYPHIRFTMDTWKGVSDGGFGLPYD